MTHETKTLFEKIAQPSAKVLTVTMLGLGAAACGSPETDYGVADKSITSLDLKDGARIREDPQVPNQTDTNGKKLFNVELSDNNSFSTAPDTLTIPTPSGVYLREKTNNGVWYGITAEDFSSIVKNKEVKKKINDDDDTLVWVNEEWVKNVDKTEESHSSAPAQ